ncbi:MAG: AMP-binding protein [Oscillospiraceae bacterium]
MVWKFNGYLNNTAVVTESGERFTYADLSERTDALAEVIGGRCLVFCMCTNSFASLTGYLSFLNHGIVPVMIDAHLDSGLLADLYANYRPDYVWKPDDISYDVFGDASGVYSRDGYTLLRTENKHVYPLNDSLALLLTTSGSTGSPKLVRQSYDNIIANTESIIEYLGIDEHEVTITTLPMSYTYGLSILNTHIYAGACVVMTDKALMQKEFWELFKSNNVTSFGGVPYVYEMLERLRFRRMDLPALKTMTQAGGKLSPALHEKFAQYAMENGKKFVVMYGQTEATARMAYLPAEKSLEKCGSMGIAIPGGKFTLLDVDDKEITDPDISGELVYSGRNVTLGYALCGEDLIKGDERGGVLKTGDIAKRDADGYYYIVGRKKRFLKLFGSRINLDETERLINDSFADIGCVCGGVDDKMYIFLVDDSRRDEVLSFITAKTGFNHSAFKIVKIDEIPRNTSNKVNYSALEKYYA